MPDRPSDAAFHALFDPKGVVVAGASTHPGKFGFVSLHNILAGGYAGGVYGTNLQGEVVLGVQTVGDIAALTSDDVWSLESLPKRLVVMGAGPIGCELAQSFQRLGSSVTLIDMADRVLPKEDADVSALVADVLRGEGIDVLTSHKAVRFEGGVQKRLIADNRDDTVDGHRRPNGRGRSSRRTLRDHGRRNQVVHPAEERERGHDRREDVEPADDPRVPQEPPAQPLLAFGVELLPELGRERGCPRILAHGTGPFPLDPSRFAPGTHRTSPAPP